MLAAELQESGRGREYYNDRSDAYSYMQNDRILISIVFEFEFDCDRSIASQSRTVRSVRQIDQVVNNQLLVINQDRYTILN